MSSNISNDRLPYVYLIRHISSGKFYAGSRTSKTCHPSDFWVSYFTSSKYIKQIISNEGKDSFEILEIIPRPNDALEYETKLLTSVNAEKSDKWINRTNGHIKFSSYGRTWTLSDEAKAKISKANLGKIVSDETRLKMSISTKNMSNETKLKLSIAGKNASVELRAKRSHAAKNISNETRAKRSLALTGKKRPPISQIARDNLSRAMKGKSKPLIVCPHCNKIGGSSPMTRWHFDNCKLI